ncbi:MAG TPA: response regulator transcription factor [Phycisphaerales bacterium]|nr:response regulator transcription factor [Phycisphaerales bacterium]
MVDDEPGFRSAWERLLARQPDFECVGGLAKADRLADHVASLTPDIVLLDLTMPGEDPIRALADLVSKGSPARVIALSGWNDAATMRSALDAGAWAYVDKLTEPNEVLATIRRVAQTDARERKEQANGSV